MDNNYGQQMTQAIRAVTRMHRDSGKLLRDLDLRLKRYHPLGGNYVTNGITADIRKAPYMADALYRVYGLADENRQVLTVNLCFVDRNDDLFDQPVIIVACLLYDKPILVQELSKRSWDAWSAYAQHGVKNTFQVLIEQDATTVSAPLLRTRLIAAPLLDIRNGQQVFDLVTQVAPEVLSR